MNCKVITNGRVCCEGDLEVLLSNTTNLQNAGRWSIVFFTGGLTCSIPEKYVIASYDGTTYSNCRRVDNGNILCYFRSPKLGSGQLCYKLYLGIADSDFSPNFRDDVYPVATNYELGPWPTDSVRAELDLLVLSGIINAQIVGATAETLPAGSQATVTLGGTATERTFAFGIPAGADGAAGEAGQITSATASVDDTTGTPSVNIELGGTPEKRTFDFKFSGLKGEPGESDDSFVRYDKAQDLTTSEQNQALDNIGLDYVIIELTNGSATLTQAQGVALLASKGVILRGTLGTGAGMEALTRVYCAENQDGDSVNFTSACNENYRLFCTYTKSTKIFKFAGAPNWVDNRAVHFTPQTLTTAQQNTALANIGLDYVIITMSGGSATLTEEQETALLASKGVILTGTASDRYWKNRVFVRDPDINTFYSVLNNTMMVYCNYNSNTKVFKYQGVMKYTDTNAVSFNTKQYLTTGQQAQARANIGIPDGLLNDADFIAKLKTKLGIG